MSATEQLERAATDGAIDDVEFSPERHTGTIERFVLDIADPELFDDAARARLHAAFKRACAPKKVDLLAYEDGEASVFVGLEVANTSKTPLHDMIKSIQANAQRAFRRSLEDAKQRNQAPSDAQPVAWGGRTYLGPVGEDYRSEPPEIPDDATLDGWARIDDRRIRSLALAHGLNQARTPGMIVESLRSQRDMEDNE